MSLAIELRKAGYKEGEWFCKEFTNNGEASSKAIIDGAYGEGRILKEYPFASLESGETIKSVTLHETKSPLNL